MISITIDEKSVSAISAGQIDVDRLCNDFEIPDSTEMTKCIQIGAHGYMLSHFYQPNDALLTISLLPEGPLGDLTPSARPEALARLMRCTSMLVTGRTRSIPGSWRSFHTRNRLSFQADRLVRKEAGGHTNAGRIVVDFSLGAGHRVFAFLLDRTGTTDINLFNPPIILLDEAIANLPQAVSLPEVAVRAEGPKSSVDLEGPLPAKITGSLTTEEWYTRRLTAAQRQFVDYPEPGSVRLVGSAGTGKTIALAVKCLRGLRVAEDKGSRARFLFLTHASATAEEIENLVVGMEGDKGVDWLASELPNLVVSTIYSLANAQMRYDLDELTPVSLDGQEGRELQADFLNMAIDEFVKGDWVTFRSSCSEPFIAYIEAASDSTERRFFLWELLNEFACVLDAEGIKSEVAKREQYLKEPRRQWMMMLQSREEREVVLALYDRFRSILRGMKAIGGDQMVTDFLGYLNSFKWDAKRDSEGFDAVFVDELHLFNRQECMVFRNLLRSPEAIPSVFMAYDAKQSPRDTFLNLSSSDATRFDLWKDRRLGKVEKIELVEVFRYTPQIAKALSFIDRSYPGATLDEDWPAYNGFSIIAEGPVPIVCTLPATKDIYEFVFKRARLMQQTLGKGKRVAVLCASNELFKYYLAYQELKDAFMPLTSRDQASWNLLSSRKFLFSMPEYVAGLQFDTVMLVEANRGEVPEGPYASAALRKFLSQVYLGASRAERQLEFYASMENGGIAPLLTQAVVNGAILQVDPTELRKRL